MEWYWSLSLLVGAAVFFMFIGVPVALAFFAANIIGAYLFFGGDIGLMQWARNVVEAVGKFPLAPVTCFVLMGEGGRQGIRRREWAKGIKLLGTIKSNSGTGR